MSNILVGIHTVTAAIQADRRRIFQVSYQKSATQVKPIVTLARSRNIPVKEVPSQELKRLAGPIPHQGIAAAVGELPRLGLNDIPRPDTSDTRSALIVLDNVQDPRNLGAILRSAEALGLAGCILPERNSAPLSTSAAKAAAGALDRLPIYQVTNISQTLRALKENYWVYGIEADGDEEISQVQFPAHTVLVLGGEGSGIRPLVKKQCDVLVKIPLTGQTPSLNVSAAAAIVLGFWGSTG